MHIILLGPSGFIGMHVAMAMLDAGHTVAGIDRPQRGVDPVLATRRLTHLAARPGFERLAADDEGLRERFEAHEQVWLVLADDPAGKGPRRLDRETVETRLAPLADLLDQVENSLAGAIAVTAAGLTPEAILLAASMRVRRRPCHLVRPPEHVIGAWIDPGSPLMVLADALEAGRPAGPLPAQWRIMGVGDMAARVAALPLQGAQETGLHRHDLDAGAEEVTLEAIEARIGRDELFGFMPWYRGFWCQARN